MPKGMQYKLPWFPTLLLSILVPVAVLPEESTAHYTGVIRAKGWSKSSESFCAGGSDYLVLETKSGSFTISSNRAPQSESKTGVSREELMKLVGKSVTIEAAPRSVTFKCDIHREQCLDAENHCAYLHVVKVLR